jgi:hypothetical protein
MESDAGKGSWDVSTFFDRRIGRLQAAKAGIQCKSPSPIFFDPVTCGEYLRWVLNSTSRSHRVKVHISTNKNHWIIVLVLTALIAVLFLFWARMVPGQTSEDENRMMSRPLLTQNGQLFAIQFSPKARRFDVLTAGYPALSLDPSRVKIFGRVFPAVGEPRDLRIVWLDGHFKIADPIDNSRPVEIEVTDAKSLKTETFRFSKSTPPVEDQPTHKQNEPQVPIKTR